MRVRFVGRCKYHRSDHSIHEQSWAFGLAEDNTGLCVFWSVNNRNRITLLSLIKNYVVEGATVKIGEWKAYASLGTEGYTHLTVNHSVNFVSSEGVHT
jgi:hypothetical protein